MPSAIVPPPSSSKLTKSKSKTKGQKSVWFKFKKFFHHGAQDNRNKSPKQQPTYAELDAEEVVLDARESAMYGWDEYGRWTIDWMYRELDRELDLETREDNDTYNLHTSDLQ